MGGLGPLRSGRRGEIVKSVASESGVDDLQIWTRFVVVCCSTALCLTRQGPDNKRPLILST